MGSDVPTAEKAGALEKLRTFVQGNPHCQVSVKDSRILIDKPWGTEDVRLSFDESDQGIIDDLNQCLLFPQYDAIIHKDANVAEFIFAYLSRDDPNYKYCIERSFTFHYDGHEFKCSYQTPSKRLFAIAKGLQRLPSQHGANVVPQLLAFRDAQRIDELRESSRKYFEGKIPRSFFVDSATPLSEIDLEQLFRHINFIMLYYDRDSPEIVIRRNPREAEFHQVKELRFLEPAFPAELSLRKMDDFILQLLESARNASPRFAFIYYYQVVEYAGFHYVDESAKKELRRILRDPSVIACSDETIEELFSALVGINNNDEARMRQVVEQYCDPGVLWHEVENDKDFFSGPVAFEGGFSLPALVSKDTTSDSWAALWTPKTFDFLTKIRNSLVHARERRQSKVILPGFQNSLLTERYLRLMARIAEQIAIRA